MWIFKKFKTQLQMDEWILKNKHKIQYTIIYINNAYALEYKILKKYD